MRQIPIAPGAALVAPQTPVARPDTPGETLMEAYAQPGISSVAGIPGVQANIPPPQFAFDQYGNRIPHNVSPPMIDETVSQNVTFTPQVEYQSPHPHSADYSQPPLTAAARSEMMDGARRIFGVDHEPTWNPICRGVVDQVLMSAEGAHVLVVTDDGARFAAFICDRPVIELGLRVELGIKHVVDSGAKRSRDVADIILVN